MLDIFENFIVFDDSAGQFVKIVAQNQQVLGVNRAIDTLMDILEDNALPERTEAPPRCPLGTGSYRCRRRGSLHSPPLRHTIDNHPPFLPARGRGLR